MFSIPNSLVLIAGHFITWTAMLINQSLTAKVDLVVAMIALECCSPSTRQKLVVVAVWQREGHLGCVAQ